MDKLLNNFTLPTMQKVLQKISAIENFNGSWLNVETYDDAPLHELKQMATVQSIGSSTRIEGSVLGDSEIDVFLKDLKKTSFTTRDEEEVAGYYRTLEVICESYDDITLSENNIKHLHKTLLQYAQKDQHHLGNYKKFANSVVATYPDGTAVTIFNTTSPMLTPMAMEQAIEWANKAMLKKEIHPLIVTAVFVYEFLSIHPFADGNGRLSRLLTTLLLLRQKYYYIQYISFEHQLEKRKKEYYGALRAGQGLRGTEAENVNEWILYFLDCMEQMTITLQHKYNLLKSRGNYMNTRQLKVMQYIKRKGQVKINDLAAAFKTVSTATLKKDVQLLVQKMKIEQTGKLKGTIYMPKD